MLLLLLLSLLFPLLARAGRCAECFRCAVWSVSLSVFLSFLSLLSVSLSSSIVSRRVSSTHLPSRASSAALVAGHQTLRLFLALRMLDPSSIRIRHAYLPPCNVSVRHFHILMNLSISSFLYSSTRSSSRALLLRTLSPSSSRPLSALRSPCVLLPTSRSRCTLLSSHALISIFFPRVPFS